MADARAKRSGRPGAGLLAALFLLTACAARGAAPPAETGDAMSLPQAALLGVVEGLTEYLPVSSTGHLLLAQRALAIPADRVSNAYAVCIQIGAILAVLGLYAGRVGQMARGLVGRSPEGRTLALLLAAAFAPAAAIGLAFHDVLEAKLFGLWPVVAAWFVGGVAILAVSRAGKDRLPPAGFGLEQLSVRGALLIGLAQCFAMWPGVSRSLVTIVGGVLAGLSLPAAVEFSFLLGVVTLTAATGYTILQTGGDMLAVYGLPSLLLGLLTATVSAVLAVRWMVAYLSRHGLAVFGTYRVALAVVTAVLLATGVLTP